jgi:hypothetical protein
LLTGLGELVSQLLRGFLMLLHGPLAWLLVCAVLVRSRECCIRDQVDLVLTEACGRGRASCYVATVLK